MSKERLEEIKEQLEESNSYDDNPNGYWYHNINWLIEQAERVQELEKDIKEWGIVNESWEETNTDLAEQNKRYREAIKGAIGKFNYDYHQEGMAELLNVLEESE